MATGLLNINPYYKGVVFDISSKPTQLAIQLQQKEQAKAEALEKYFMDYEKSINPKGLGRGEQDVFTKKYNAAREYWMKNKDCILHPTKCGAEAQSTYLSYLKDAQGYIELGKQAAAERKAFVDYISKQKAQGKHISDNYLQIAENAMKPVEAGYVAPDLSQIQIYDPHNEKQFTTNVWGGIDLPKREVFVDEVIGNKKTGKVIKQTYQDINNDVIKNVALGAANEYRSNRGTREHFNELFQDKAFTSQINNVFKKRFDRDIKDAEDLAIGYALTQKPGGLIKTEAPTYPDLSWQYKFNQTQDAINARANKYNQGLVEEGNLLDLIPDINLASGGKVSGGVAFDKNGAPLNGEIYLEKENLPTEWFSVIGNPKGVKGFNVKFVDGNPEKISNPKIGNITRQSMINYQRKYNTEPKNAPQLDFSKGSKFTATGANGVKIYSKDGVNWFDKSGKKIQ